MRRAVFLLLSPSLDTTNLLVLLRPAARSFGQHGALMNESVVYTRHWRLPVLCNATGFPLIEQAQEREKAAKGLWGHRQIFGSSPLHSPSTPCSLNHSTHTDRNVYLCVSLLDRVPERKAIRFWYVHVFFFLSEILKYRKYFSFGSFVSNNASVHPEPTREKRKKRETRNGQFREISARKIHKNLIVETS